MSASREAWERLQSALVSEVGVEVRLDERHYSQTVYGRVEHGVSRSLFIRLGGGFSISVATVERYGTWSWTVALEDAEGITINKPRYDIKRRADVVEQVQRLVRQAAAA